MRLSALQRRTQILRRVERIQKQLGALGPIHPGHISEQYNVCGTPGCQCKDPDDPRKHGPYYQLSFKWGGRSSTRFVRAEQLAPMREKVANHRQLRELVNEWLALAVELETIEREDAKRRGH